MSTEFLESQARPRATTARRKPHLGGVRAPALVGLGVLLMLSLQPQRAHAQGTDVVNVSRSSQASIAPCPSWGEIHGLDPQGDGFLAVRTGPGTNNEQVDELHEGDVVILCDYRNGWHRVVYPGEGQEARECSTNPEAMPNSEPYRGPCKSGWVHGNWVRWIAA